MGKWELRTEGCKIPLARDVESGEWIGHSDVAEFFVAAHNADIERLEAENANLRAKIDDIRNNVGCARGQRTTQFCAEAVALRAKLDAVMAIPEPVPPCPCKPMSWRSCTCGAYRKGGFSTAQIDAYAESMEVWESVRAIVEGE